MKPTRPPVLRASALACATLLACAGAAAQPRTTLVVMPAADPAAAAQAFGLNDAGVLVGSQSVPGAASQPVVWPSAVFGAQPQLLGLPGGALAVGAGGTVVGSAVFDGIGLRGFAWTGAGGLQNLGVLPGGSLSFATAVDDAGRIVGLSQAGGSATHAFLVEPGAAMQDLGTLGGSTSSAYGVANGVVVGSSTDTFGSLQAYAWTAGGGMQGVGPLGEASEARAVNRGGLVVGRAVFGGNDMAFLWTPGDRARVLVGSEGFHGAAVNDAGQVLLRHGGGGNSMLWVEGGTPAKLHTLAGSGVTHFDAVAINAHAQVAGTATGTATGGVARPVLLTLHPEWQGGSGHWDNSGGAHWNWAGTGVAAATVGAMHEVVIDPDVDATVSVGTAAARSLRVGGRGTNAVTLRLGGNLTLSGAATLAAGGTLTGGGTLKAQSISIAEHADVRVLGRLTLESGYDGLGYADVDNAGTVRVGSVQPGGYSQFQLPSGLHNQAIGRMEVANSDVNYGRYVSNAGEWTWSGNTRMGTDDFNTAFNNSAGGRLLYGAGRHETYSSHGHLFNRGRIELAPGATWALSMDLTSTGELDIAAGARFELSFIRDASLAGATGQGRIQMAGYLRPAFGVGPVRIEPTLVMLSSSRLTMGLYGPTPGAGPGHHEKFVFDGAVELAGGTFMLQADPSHTPQAGDSYDFFDWNGGLSGSFSALRLPTLADGLSWDVSDLYAGGTLGVTAVPEPGTWALMLAGLAGVLRVVRRRG